MHHFFAALLHRIAAPARLAVLALAAGVTFANTAAGAGDGVRWPNGARAAVSLGYDDALDSQLDHAIPALDRVGLRATFYLQLSSPAVAQRLDAWRAAAGRGHELGNHSLFHQCSGAGTDRAWVARHRDLDSTSAEQMRDQVLLANTMLMAIDGQRERTYTAPCGDVLAAGRDYLPLLTSDFVAIKAGHGRPGIPASMAAFDPYLVGSIGPVGTSGKELIEMVRQAGKRGTMVAFTFHGIGGDHLSVSKEAHEELVRFLAAHRDEYWTDTFLNIMRHVRSEQARKE